MNNRIKLIIGIICIALCVLCAGMSIWSLFQRDSIHVQAVPTDLGPHEVPIRYVEGKPLVDCLINEIPAVMMIDTGADSILVNESALVRFHIEKGLRSHSANVPGGVSVKVSSVSTFAIAFPSVDISAEIRGANCTVFGDVEHDGLLGGDFLRAIGARIDYRRGVLEFQCKEDPNSP